MEPKSQKPTPRAGSVSNSPRPTTRMSAEDKLKKSIKNLSYTSGGSGSMNMGTTRTTAKSSSTAKSSIATTSETSRKKVGGVVLDVETIQDATKQKLETRGKRNNVIIIILSILLVISLVYLAVAVVGYMNGKRESNCKFSVQGNAQAEWIIEGGKDTEFALKDGLEADSVYGFNCEIDIKTIEEVTLSVEIIVKLEGNEILVAGLKDIHDNLLRVEGENIFSYKGTISGGGRIKLFTGIDFADAPSNLNSRNITIEVIAHVNTVV